MKKVIVFGVLILFLTGFISAIPITSSAIANCAEEGEEVYDMPSKGPISCCEGLILKKCAGECTPSILGTCIKCRDENAACTIDDIPCCEGLTEVLLAVIDEETGRCAAATCGSICRPCGNGICDDNENKCNCPEDCSKGELTQSQIRGIIKDRNKITANVEIRECPINCTCTGSVTTCRISGGREMTITAGKSGNTLVQVKGINVTTNVTLYKTNETIYGVFRNNETRAVRILPDEIKDRIRQRIKARLENQTIELDEDGIYQVRAQKRARLFLIFPVRTAIQAEINSETGEIVRLRDSWWSFLAKDVEEETEEQ